jgi:GNAT superfamily N-acetyltransferase
LRRATPADAPALTAVHRASRVAAYGHLGTPEQAAGAHVTVEHWREWLGRSSVWVVERDGKVVAFVSVDGTVLTGLYVHPDAQGDGLGTDLLAVAVEQGARELWVYAEHPQARGFYERRGWRPAGEPEVSDDAWSLPAPALRYVRP